MSQSSEIRNLMKARFHEKQNRIGAIPGQLGDGFGHVTVTAREHYVYCRLAGSTVEVFNNRVPAENDLLVMVGYDPTQPDLFQVLSTRSAVPGGVSGGAVTGYASSSRYQWMAQDGGQDPIFIDKRQYLPLRIGAMTGMLLQVYRDFVWSGTAWVAVNTQNFSLSSYIPTTTGKAALVLITIDNTGAVVKTKGAEVDIAALSITDLPTPPAGTVEVLGAVRVYYGQTAILEARTNTDIIDLRDTWAAAGEGGGTLADHDHSGDAGDGGTFDAANLTSGAAPDGYTLTADGAGGAAWEAAAGSGLEDWFNVKTYGAAGDGTTNDTAAIQSALDAAAFVGGVVYFPAGTYLSNTLTCYHNVTLKGAGKVVSTIKAASAVTLLDYGVPTGLDYYNPIQDLMLDGNNVGTVGIAMTGVAALQIERTWIYNFTSKGIYLRAALVFSINDSEIKFNGTGISNEAYTLSVSGSVRPNMVQINDTVISSNTVWGIDWKQGGALILNSVDMENNGTTGNAATGAVKFTPSIFSLGLVVQDSWFEYNNGFADIYLNTPEAAGVYSSIDDTLFTDDSGVTYGVYVEGAVRQNNLLCRNAQFYSNAATADFYANDTNSAITLEYCVGTTGGSGTINTPSTHAAVTVTDTATIDLTLSGQAVSADLKNTTVTPGSYTNADITVDAQGRITVAANGTVSATAGQILVTGASPTAPLTNDADTDYLYEG